MKTIVIVISLLYLLTLFVQYRLLINKQEFEINGYVRLNNNYKIKIETYTEGGMEIIGTSKFFKNNIDIDPDIYEYKEFTFTHYFIGENGDYIFNKLKNKLIQYSNFEELSKSQKRRFNKYFDRIK